MSEEDFANRQYKHPSEIIPILKKAGFRVAAACYPEKHYEAPSMEEDLHWLKHKVEQGADALISQLFFDNDAFTALWMQLTRKESLFLSMQESCQLPARK